LSITQTDFCAKYCGWWSDEDSHNQESISSKRWWSDEVK